MKINFILFFQLFFINILSHSLYTEINTQINDSLKFAFVEQEFNNLMDTTNMKNYQEFSDTYKRIILLTSEPGVSYDFTEFDKIYQEAIDEIGEKINGFRNIKIPKSLPSKMIKRLNESKHSFEDAYVILLKAIKKIYLYTKERYGVYLIDYNNLLLEFNGKYNRGLIKFSQAKMKVK